MKTITIEERLSQLPVKPGVYIMKNAHDEIIYIGKAKILRNRVRSYFDGREKIGHRAANLMLPHIQDIEWIITETEAEALILEATLIRKHTPVYNVRQKDDKHFPYLVLTIREAFPRLILTRSIRPDGNLYFGPFLNSRAIHQLVDIAARLFHIRECHLKLPGKDFIRPCLNYPIGRCAAPCAGLCSEEEYRKGVHDVTLLLEGKRNDLIAEWEHEMDEASQKLDFETASKKRDAILALKALHSSQKADASDASLTLDVISVKRNKKVATAVILEYRAGVFFGRRHFNLECNLEQSESEILQEMIGSWYFDSEVIPKEIAIDTDLPEDHTLLEEALSAQANHKVSIIKPQRGEKLGFLKLAGANAEMLLVEMMASAQKYDDVEQSVFTLQKELQLKNTPFRMECIDISHLAGTHTVASLVSFKNGKPDKSNYRKFKIKNVSGVDDFGSMREVLTRRIERLHQENRPMPDLFVIDGGKGQVEATASILRELNEAEIPLIGLAKKLEEIVFPGNTPSIILRRQNPALQLLQKIRDEAPRFAITYQRSKRNLDLQVEWLAIPGIGPSTKKKILSKYRQREAFLNAPKKDLEILLGKKRSDSVFEKISKYKTKPHSKKE